MDNRTIGYSITQILSYSNFSPQKGQWVAVTGNLKPKPDPQCGHLKYLTVLNDEKLDAGWYSYKTDNGTTTNYIYLNSKGTVAIAGDTKRFDSDAMILLYEAFYSENISIQKTNIGFSTTQNNMAIEFSLTNEIPDWCKNFEYL